MTAPAFTQTFGEHRGAGLPRNVDPRLIEPARAFLTGRPLPAAGTQYRVRGSHGDLELEQATDDRWWLVARRVAESGAVYHHGLDDDLAATLTHVAGERQTQLTAVDRVVLDALRRAAPVTEGLDDRLVKLICLHLDEPTLHTVTKTGAWYAFATAGQPVKALGMSKVIALLHDRPALVAQLAGQVRDAPGLTTPASLINRLVGPAPRF